MGPYTEKVKARKKQARAGKVSPLNPGKQIKKNKAAAAKKAADAKNVKKPAAKKPPAKKSPAKTSPKPTPKPTSTPKPKPTPTSPSAISKSGMLARGTSAVAKGGRGGWWGLLGAGLAWATSEALRFDPKVARKQLPFSGGSKKLTKRQRIVAEMQGKTPKVSVAPESIAPPIAGTTRGVIKPKSASVKEAPAANKGVRKDYDDWTYVKKVERPKVVAKATNRFQPTSKKSKPKEEQKKVTVVAAEKPLVPGVKAASGDGPGPKSKPKVPKGAERVTKDFDTTMGVYGWNNLTNSFGYLGTEKEVGKLGGSTYFTEGYRRGSKKKKKA